MNCTVHNLVFDGNYKFLKFEISLIFLIYFWHSLHITMCYTFRNIIYYTKIEKYMSVVVFHIYFFMKAISNSGHERWCKCYYKCDGKLLIQKVLAHKIDPFHYYCMQLFFLISSTLNWMRNLNFLVVSSEQLFIFNH